MSKQKYIAGDEFTLADLFHLTCGAFISTAGSGDLVEKRPNVKRFVSVSVREKRGLTRSTLGGSMISALVLPG